MMRICKFGRTSSTYPANSLHWLASCQLLLLYHIFEVANAPWKEFRSLRQHIELTARLQTHADKNSPGKNAAVRFMKIFSFPHWYTYQRCELVWTTYFRQGFHLNRFISINQSKYIRKNWIVFGMGGCRKPTKFLKYPVLFELQQFYWVFL